MSQLVRYPKTPQCFSCIRSILSFESSLAQSPFRTQIRGKKKKIKLPPTINVKLLKDIRGYGRRGAIVPVMPGRMRNIWYPSKRAEYMTDAQLKTMQEVAVERDFSFGIERPGTSTDDKLENRASVQVNLLPPQVATQVLSLHVPDILEFYRPPISITEPGSSEKPAPSRRVEGSTETAAADLTTVAHPPSKSLSVAIYGSVSTADIAASIQAVLDLAPSTAENADVARLFLSAEDIKIVQEEGSEATEEVDRVKTLGDFTIDIQVRGGEKVRRIVRIQAEVSRKVGN